MVRCTRRRLIARPRVLRPSACPCHADTPRARPALARLAAVSRGSLWLSLPTMCADAPTPRCRLRAGCGPARPRVDASAPSWVGSGCAGSPRLVCVSCSQGRCSTRCRWRVDGGTFLPVLVFRVGCAVCCGRGGGCPPSAAFHRAWISRTSVPNRFVLRRCALVRYLSGFVQRVACFGEYVCDLVLE